MKIYLSGKITGLEVQDAQEKFSRYESSLITMGFESIVNPMKISPYKQEKGYTDYMRDCVRALCDCDTIALMPCWTGSRGAQIEKRIAEDLGMQVLYL